MKNNIEQASFPKREKGFSPIVQKCRVVQLCNKAQLILDGVPIEAHPGMNSPYRVASITHGQERFELRQEFINGQLSDTVHVLRFDDSYYHPGKTSLIDTEEGGEVLAPVELATLRFNEDDNWPFQGTTFVDKTFDDIRQNFDSKVGELEKILNYWNDILRAKAARAEAN